MDHPLEIATKGMFTRNVFLDDAGISRGKTRLLWADVDHYFYDLDDYRKRGDFVLVAKSGGNVVLSPIFDHWSLAAEHVFESLHPLLRAEPYYAPFGIAEGTLTRTGLVPLPLADIDHVELAPVLRAVGVFVHARGGREWARADIGEIANLWLFLDALREHGVGVRSELDFHLPPPMFPLVAHLAAAQALPAAKLVR